MSYKSTFTRRALIGAVVMFFAVPALADKPAWAGKKNRENGSREESSRVSVSVNAHFGERHRVAVREYFVDEHRHGRCPPGLAKKNNGCMPPGQAKKWHIGHPLPHDVVYYDLPPALVVKIGAPPPGYRYVRVASDILLIAVGTALIVDAIQDLGRL